MFEAEKLEGFRPPISMTQTRNGCETSKENTPCFLLSQLQSKFCKSLPHMFLEAVCIFPKLKGHHEIIGEARQICFALTVRLDFLFKPQIENEVKVKVTQQG